MHSFPGYHGSHMFLQLWDISDGLLWSTVLFTRCHSFFKHITNEGISCYMINLKLDSKVCFMFEKTNHEKGTIVTYNCFWSFLIKKKFFEMLSSQTVTFRAIQFARCPVLNKTPVTANKIWDISFRQPSQSEPTADNFRHFQSGVLDTASTLRYNNIQYKPHY